MSNYYVGSGIADVTDPAAGAGMMGFADDTQKTGGVEFRLYARTFVVWDRDSDKRVAIVTADIWSCTQAVKEEVVSRLSGFADGVYALENVLINGQHTHSAPGGYSHYRLYNHTIGGFDAHNFECVVSGIVLSIQRAHENLAAGKIYVNEGDITDCGRQRSAIAYNNNPLAERKKYDNDSDKKMLLLKFVVNAGGREVPIGILAWYAIHPTDFGQKNTRVHGDNKGYASYLFEWAMKSDPYEDTPFVAAFANSNCGDISGNVEYEQIPDGIHDGEHMAHHGDKQFRKAMELFDSANQEVKGGIDFRHTYVDMSSATGLPGALGISFAAGSTSDGKPGVPLLREGIVDGDVGVIERALQGLAALATPIAAGAGSTLLMTPEDIKGHLPKPIFMATGIAAPHPITPNVQPLQLLKIGQVIAIGLPAEITTMAGRRLRATIETEMPGTTVTLAAYANGYSGYVTTREEYDMQYYEGASTLFGPGTLEAYQNEYREMTQALRDGQEVVAAATPPELASSLRRLRRITVRNLSGSSIKLEFYNDGDDIMLITLPEGSKTIAAHGELMFKIPDDVSAVRIRLDGSRLVREVFPDKLVTIREDGSAVSSDYKVARDFIHKKSIPDMTYYGGVQWGLVDDIVFDGKARHIELPPLEFDFSAGMSVEAWVRYAKFQNGSRIIDFGSGPQTDNIVFADDGSSGNLFLDVYRQETAGGNNTSITEPVTRFDGKNDNVSIPKKDEFKIQKEITLEAWVNVSAQKRHAGILSKVYDTGNTESGYGLLLNGASGILFAVTPGSRRQIVWQDVDNVLTLNQWHHVACTWDGQQMRTYVDGEEKAAQSVEADAIYHTPDNDLFIGQYKDNDETHPFSGSLSEVRLWNVARTAEQIQADKDQRLTGKEEGLVGCWPLNEVNDVGLTTDLTGDNHGTVRGALVTDIVKTPLFSANGQAPSEEHVLELDGTAGSYMIANPFNGFPSKEITAECWLKSDDATKAGTPIAYAKSGDNDFVLYDHRNLDTNMRQSHLPSNIAFNDGHWHHLAVTWQSGDGAVKVYKDGKLVSSGHLAKGKSIEDGGAFVLGQEQDSVGGGFDAKQAYKGMLSEVRIWNHARSADDIAADMRRRLTGNESGLVGYWPLDEGSGTVAHDKSGNGNDGVLHAGTWKESEAGLSQLELKASVPQSGTAQSVRGSIKAEAVLEVEKWMHVAATIDASGQAVLYKNGQPCNSGPVLLPQSTLRGKCYIGRSNGPNDGYFSGRINELRLWNRTRTAEEIQADMHEQLGGSEAGLVGYWPLNETCDRKAGDKTAQTNHGTLHNGTDE